MALGAGLGRAYTQITDAPDHELRIAPPRFELAPGKVIDTFTYNDSVPGPALRLHEGRALDWSSPLAGIFLACSCNPRVISRLLGPRGRVRVPHRGSALPAV